MRTSTLASGEAWSSAALVRAAWRRDREKRRDHKSARQEKRVVPAVQCKSKANWPLPCRRPVAVDATPRLAMPAALAGTAAERYLLMPIVVPTARGTYLVLPPPNEATKQAKPLYPSIQPLQSTSARPSCWCPPPLACTGTGAGKPLLHAHLNIQAATNYYSNLTAATTAVELKLC